MAAQTITIRVVLDARDIERELTNIGSSVDRAARATSGTFGAAGSAVQRYSEQLRNVGVAMSAGVTVPLGIVAREVLRVGNEYERSMNLFQAATKASAEQMREAADVAKRLGADLSLPTASAGDAARTMTELAKSGLTASEAMEAARGTMLLAAAAGIEEARAAEIAGNALNTFGLKASEAGRVADLLAASANASSAEITDVAQAMQQSGASAAALRIPIEDLVTAIGLMANAGIKGSDVGTSLKTALAALTPSSDKAAAAMKQLGIDAFDANGQFIGFKAVIEQAQPALARMTDEQKAFAIETAFGSDAMRAANILLGAGTEAWDKMSAGVNRANAAAELAAARTKGLAGAWEGLKSQLETGALVLFERMSPTLEKIVRDLAGLTGEMVESVSAFAKANPGLTEFGLKAGVVLTVAGPLLVAVGGLVAGIGLISTPVLVAVGAFVGFGVAIAAVMTLLGKASPIYADFNNTTLTLVRSANELVAVRQREIDKLQTYVNSCDESREALSNVHDVYNRLNPIQRARVDLLVGEARNTDSVTTKAAALLKVQREMLEVERAQANLKLAEIAEDYLKRANNAAEYARKVADLNSQLAYFTRELENNTRAGIGNNVVTEDGRTLNQTYREALTATSTALLSQQEAQAKNKKEFDEVADKLRIAAFITGTNEDAVIRLLGVYDKLPGSLGNAREALRNLGIQQTEYGPAAQEAAAAARKQFETVGKNINEGVIKGLKDTQGAVNQQITQQQQTTLKAAKDAVRAKSPAQAYVEVGVDMGDGLRIGAVEGFKRANRAVVDVMGEGLAAITLKASEITKAARDFAKEVEKSLREVLLETTTQLNASLKTLTFQRATAEARDFGRALDEVADLQRELNIPVSQTVAVYKELNAIQRRTGEDEATFQRRRLDGARAVVEGLRGVQRELEAQQEAVRELEKAWASLRSEEQKLSADRARWAQDANADWLKQGHVVEQVADEMTHAYAGFTDSAMRNRIKQAIEAERQSQYEKTVEEKARQAIKEADVDARDSIVRNRVFIADQSVFHSERATAAILDHLARQKGVSESVASAFISLYDSVFGKLDNLIDGWTQKLGVFGSFVGELFKGVVHGIANQILSGLLGEGGILKKAIDGIGNFLSGLVNRAVSSLGQLFKIPGLNGATGAFSGATATGSATGAGGIGGLGGALGGFAGLFGGVTAGIGIGGAIGGSGGSGAIGRIGGALAGAGAFGLLAGWGGTAAALGTAGASVGIASSAAVLLSNPITAIAGGALLVGAYLLNRAKQRRNDEEASGEALQAQIDLIKATGAGIDNDEFQFADGNEAQAFLNQSVLQPFKDFINTLKTKSVRDSRLTNQVRDLENLYNQVVGDAIKRQQDRIAAANAAATTAATGTTSTGNPDAGASLFGSLAPTTVTIETLNVELFVGEGEATKVMVTGAKTKDGKDVIVKTIKIAAANGEL